MKQLLANENQRKNVGSRNIIEPVGCKVPIRVDSSPVWVKLQPLWLRWDPCYTEAKDFIKSPDRESLEIIKTKL